MITLMQDEITNQSTSNCNYDTGQSEHNNPYTCIALIPFIFKHKRTKIKKTKTKQSH